MASYRDVVNDDYGRPIPGVLVYVFTKDGSLAPLIGGQANPITTDTLGGFSFNAADAVYSLEFRFAGVTRRLDNIIVGSPPEFQGDTGPTGPANSTFLTKTALVNAPITNGSYIFAPRDGSDGGTAAGTFLYQTAGAPYTEDGVNIIKLRDAPLTTGALVRQTDASIASQAPGGVPQDAASRQNRAYRTPEDYGAIGYATLAEAMAATTDSTAAMQKLFDFCAANAVIASGNDRWYRVGTVNVPSRLTAMNIRTFSLPSAVDNAPFDMSYDRTGVIRDVTLVACGGHGNRANQTALATSGGDGQRAIFKVWNRTENVQLLGCFAWHAATDGIWVWHAFVDPANGTDYCHRDLVIQDPDVNWCGRHGISISSVYRCRVSANGKGFLTNNGKDLPGATGGGYTDGKYGRRFAGSLYGRGITFESFPNGDGFDTMEWTGLDCRGNVGGALILHVRHQTPCYRLRVTNCQYDDPGGVVGDGAFITTVTDAATGATYTGTDGIVDAAFVGNKYYRNAPFLRNIFGLTVADALSSVDPAVSVYGFNLASTVANIAYFSCPSNRAVNGLVSPIAVSSLTQFFGAGWTANAQPLDFLGFTPLGKFQFHLRVMVTSDAAEPGGFDVNLPAGWTDVTDVRVGISNNDTGDAVAGNAFRSNNAANAVSFTFTSNAPHVYLVDLYFTAARP